MVLKRRNSLNMYLIYCCHLLAVLPNLSCMRYLTVYKVRVFSSVKLSLKHWHNIFLVFSVNLIVIILGLHSWNVYSFKSMMERALGPKFHYFSLFLVLTLGNLLLIFLSICFSHGESGTLITCYIGSQSWGDPYKLVEVNYIWKHC